MHCIDGWRGWTASIAGLGLAGVMVGCGSAPEPARAPAVAAPAAVPVARAATAATPSSRLPSAAAARNWTELRMQAAQRMVAANPAGTYTGAVPEPLLAVPVLEIELNADGSVHHINVLRQPHENKDTMDIAAEAVRRAAPFGDVSRLPKPWRFTETFLFNDERKFKPRTLDQ